MTRRWWTPSGTVLLMYPAMCFVTSVGRVAVPLAAEAARAELGTSKTQLGPVFSAFAYPCLICHVIGGWFGDRFRVRRTLAGVVAAFAMWSDRPFEAVAGECTHA